MEFITTEERTYAIGPDNNVVAEVTFPVIDGIAVINHTFVDESLRGQGIADSLVRAAADKILADGNKIGATCRYAKIWLQRHPEYTEACVRQTKCNKN